eukprot:TRINITY_DN18892_c0_g1_i1.p1 TRINITY_DN18892_c0_g1~~TRINITY_DN18892_c0_g1_i1.p1  ORF type:complete len:653 (+),score=135.56 TRINITY_DN18892_c0_g1_i1:26-1960(+)
MRRLSRTYGLLFVTRRYTPTTTIYRAPYASSASSYQNSESVNNTPSEHRSGDRRTYQDNSRQTPNLKRNNSKFDTRPNTFKPQNSAYSTSKPGLNPNDYRNSNSNKNHHHRSTSIQGETGVPETRDIQTRQNFTQNSNRKHRSPPEHTNTNPNRSFQKSDSDSNKDTKPTSNFEDPDEIPKRRIRAPNTHPPPANENEVSNTHKDKSFHNQTPRERLRWISSRTWVNPSQMVLVFQGLRYQREKLLSVAKSRGSLEDNDSNNNNPKNSLSKPQANKTKAEKNTNNPANEIWRDPLDPRKIVAAPAKYSNLVPPPSSPDPAPAPVEKPSVETFLSVSGSEGATISGISETTAPVGIPPAILAHLSEIETQQMIEINELTQFALKNITKVSSTPPPASKPTKPVKAEHAIGSEYSVTTAVSASPPELTPEAKQASYTAYMFLMQELLWLTPPAFVQCKQLLLKMKNSNTLTNEVPYHFLVRCCSKIGTREKFFEALNIYKDMLDHNIPPTRETYNLLIGFGMTVLDRGQRRVLKELMEESVKEGLKLTRRVAELMIKVCEEDGDLKGLMIALAEMKKDVKREEEWKRIVGKALNGWLEIATRRHRQLEGESEEKRQLVEDLGKVVTILRDGRIERTVAVPNLTKSD